MASNLEFDIWLVKHFNSLLSKKAFSPIAVLIQLSTAGDATLVKTYVPKQKSLVPGPLTTPNTVVISSVIQTPLKILRIDVVCVRGPLKNETLFKLRKIDF